MAYENKDKGKFERRITVVEDIIRRIGLKSSEVTPIRWDEDQVFPYNNYIYKVTLSSPASANDFPEASRQPCTEPPADGIFNVIVRLSNPTALAMNNTNRVETEVAAMHLSRIALAKLNGDYAGLVPKVYAWKAAAKPEPVDEKGFGWIMMEYLTGSSLYEAFEAFDMSEKQRTVREIAAFFSAMQKMKLPPGVDRFGGFTINDEGNIISGQATMQPVPGGPWTQYDDYWRHEMLWQLEKTDSNDIIQGWRARGVRERVETFIHERLRVVLTEAGIDVSELAFVHADFTMSNMLYDKNKSRISGIVDFDWAGATHPINEYFNSLVWGTTTGGQSSKKLERAILTGDFRESDDPSEQDHGEAWKLAQTWHEAIKEHGGLRLSDISGVETLLKLNAFTDMLNPYPINVLDYTRDRTAEQNAEARAEAEKAIDEMLRGWGA